MTEKIFSDIFLNKNTNNAGIRNLTTFDGFTDNRYLDPFINGYAYVFITKPSLFLYPYSNGSTIQEKLAYENMTRDPFFAQFITDEAMNASDKLSLKYLSYFTNYTSMDEYYKKTNFIPIFTNRIKNMDSQDITMEQHEAFDTKQGFKMVLPTFKTPSEASNSISFDAMETDNIDLTKIMALWVNYISNITDGTFSANPYKIRNGELDYMSSIFYFVLAPDGKTLKYWAKYTGCWPVNIPYSALKYTKGSQEASDLSLSFVYTVKEDMNPEILKEFNKISLNIDYTDEEVEDGVYSPIKKSKFLNPEASDTLFDMSDTTRGPLVIYNMRGNISSENNTILDNCFELTFGSDTIKDNSFIYNKIGDDYFISMKNFTKFESKD